MEADSTGPAGSGSAASGSQTGSAAASATPIDRGTSNPAGSPTQKERGEKATAPKKQKQGQGASETPVEAGSAGKSAQSDQELPKPTVPPPWHKKAAGQGQGTQSQRASETSAGPAAEQKREETEGAAHAEGKKGAAPYSSAAASATTTAAVDVPTEQDKSFAKEVERIRSANPTNISQLFDLSASDAADQGMVASKYRKIMVKLHPDKWNAKGVALAGGEAACKEAYQAIHDAKDELQKTTPTPMFVDPANPASWDPWKTDMPQTSWGTGPVDATPGMTKSANKKAAQDRWKGFDLPTETQKVERELEEMYGGEEWKEVQGVQYFPDPNVACPYVCHTFGK